MIAHLGMYDPPALRPANDRFWQAIRAALGFGPQHLSHDVDIWDVWRSAELLFSQTCGMPFRTKLHPNVTLIGTPDYGLQGCRPGYYRSMLIARIDDPRDQPEQFDASRFAYNEALSQSGWAGPMTYLGDKGISFSALVETGGHRFSAIAVAEERADLAGLDALTWMLLGEHEPDLCARLRVIATTHPTPTLPFITASGRDPAPIADAIRTAISTLSKADRKALHLHGLVNIPAADYLAIPTPSGP